MNRIWACKVELVFYSLQMQKKYHPWYRIISQYLEYTSFLPGNTLQCPTESNDMVHTKGCHSTSNRFPWKKQNSWTILQFYRKCYVGCDVTDRNRKYCIYPCIMHTFFPKFEVQNLHCALYTESFVYCYTNLHTHERTRKNNKLEFNRLLLRLLL